MVCLRRRHRGMAVRKRLEQLTMTATRRSAGRSHLMHGALELLADGVAPRVAAERAGVTLQALYRAMRQEGIGTRCPMCGKLDTKRLSTSEHSSD